MQSAPSVAEAWSADEDPPERDAARQGQGLSRSLGTAPLTDAEKRETERIRRERLPVLPATRAACAGVPRPCPFVSCRHSLYLDRTHGGAVKLLFPDREPGDMPAAWSCSLDVADRFEHRGASLPQIGRALNVSMARAGQIQDEALAKLREHPDGPALLEALADVVAARDRGPAPQDSGSEESVAGADFVEALSRAAERYGARPVSRVVRARRDPLNR